MVDVNVLQSMITGFMDEIPEVEGVVVFNSKGELINGYTFQEFDHNVLALKSLEFAKNALNISKYLGKGKIAEMTIITKEGVIVIIGKGGFVATVFTGNTGKPQLGLIRHELNIFMDVITKP